MVSKNFIPRHILKELNQNLEPGKVTVIYGPRRVGKTTIINKFLENYTGKYQLFTGEDLNVQKIFTVQTVAHYQSLLKDTELLIIDEAQKIDHIGINLKLIVDHLPHLKIIASGSSSFDLAAQVGEPLTGRKWTYILYPIAQLELKETESLVETKSLLEERLLFGSYPEVITAGSRKRKINILTELVNSYLYKDLLELEGIKFRKKITDLLTLLAFQIGGEVSLSELGNNLDISKNTVARYLDLLEKAFVVINIRGFSRNLRKEVTKNSRYFFYDIGVRNALINNFNLLSRRDDIGMLWENYLAIERIKRNAYYNVLSNNYFWRTYEQKEIDWVEEREGKLYGYEIKWKKSRVKPPKDWLETYKNAEYQLVNQDNYLKFIT